MNTVTYLITFDTSAPDNVATRALNAYNAFYTQLSHVFPYMSINDDITCLADNNHLRCARIAFTFTTDTRVSYWNLVELMVYIQTYLAINIYQIKLSYFDYAKDEFGELIYDPSKRAEDNLHGIYINEYNHRQIQPIAMTPRMLHDRMQRLSETLPSESTVYHFEPHSLLSGFTEQDQDEVPL